MKKALVIAGSRGIGKGIADSLETLNQGLDDREWEVLRTSTKILDTSKTDQVNKFVESEMSKNLDILVLNTGGPAPKEFNKITEDECLKYHNQLFYGFFRILQKIRINKGGYIFLISSYNVKEPDAKLLLSNAYRLAFISVFKCLSKELAKENITTINIAPGPINTDRLRNLVDDINVLSQKLPLGRVGSVEEIGNFVKSIVENNIKYLSGVTINFDGGASNSLF